VDRRWLLATAVIAAGLVLVACSGSSADDATPTSQVRESSTETDTEDETEDQLAPLVITSLAPDPIPFTGSDGKVHVAYELSVLNFAPNPAVITLLEHRLVAAATDGDRITSLTTRSARGGHELRFRAPFFIDTTGTAMIGHLVGAETMSGRESRSD